MGKVEGNYNCKSSQFGKECCFCKPNGIRTSQVGVWVPQTRNAEGTQNIIVRNLVSSSTQADGINLHGYVRNATVQGAYMANTGDDTYALWGGDMQPEDVAFRDSIAENPGVLRPLWYGNCIATYGLKAVLFANMTCRAPPPKNPILAPGSTESRYDTSMIVFYTSFGGVYPTDNNVTIKGWTFEDLQGNVYTAATGSMNKPMIGKMAWTKTDADKGGLLVPFYREGSQQINVYASQPADAATGTLRRSGSLYV